MSPSSKAKIKGLNLDLQKTVEKLRRDKSHRILFAVFCYRIELDGRPRSHYEGNACDSSAHLRTENFSIDTFLSFYGLHKNLGHSV